MKKKQRIPGYMKNDINKKPKVKYIEIILDVMGKIPRMLPLYVTALGAFHIFLWAFNISSGSIGDTAFIIQKEGVGGGVFRILTLMVSHSMMLVIASAPSMIVIILISLSSKYGFWLHEKTGRLFNRRISHFLYSCICGILLFSAFLYLAGKIIYEVLNSDLASKFELNDSFAYWVEPENVIPQIVAIFIVILLAFSIMFFINFRGNRNNTLAHRRILWIVIFLISLSPFFMFTHAYSKGYGTECVSLETEDNMIVESSVNMGNGEEGKKNMSEVIQSGGGYITNILNEGKGNKNYVLSSYVYSEDKDYLNIMVFSIREWYKDDRGNDRTGNDLLINKKGEGRNGVLVSIKKSSIKNRFTSIPLCFNGK